MTWTILIETSPDEFTPTGETFTGDMAAANARLAELHAATGVCHAAQARS